MQEFYLALKVFILLVFFMILLDLSITDIKEKLIYPRYYFAIIVTTIPLLIIPFSENIYERILGSLIISLPTFILILINEKTFGGGDVKLFFLFGFILGIKGIINLAIIAFILAGIISLLLLLAKTRGKNESIAFAPFISIGFLISYINIYF